MILLADDDVVSGAFDVELYLRFRVAVAVVPIPIPIPVAVVSVFVIVPPDVDDMMDVDDDP